MNKKGIGLEGIVIIIVMLVGFLILLGLLIFGIKPWAEKDVASTATCRMSIMQAGTWLGQKALEKGQLPRLNCPKISVEIKGETQEEIMKELINLMIKVSYDFGATETFSRMEGRYCRRRYHPITFKKKDIDIYYIEKTFVTSIEEAIVHFKLVPKFPESIYTDREYSIVFVADYDESWGQWGYNVFVPSFWEERLKGEDEGIMLVESDKIIEEGCKHLV